MAVFGNTVDTLANWAKGRDPDGATAEIVELLDQSNEVNWDMAWAEGNMPLGNRTTVRVSLPNVYTRQLGQAVATSTSRVAQFDDTMAIIEAWNEVDCKLADLEGDTGAYRYNAMLPYFEAMSQEFAYLVFYGDTTVDPTQFFGLTSRYATLTAANAATSANVLNGGGTSSANASVWLVNHGRRGTLGIFPKGSPAGLQHEDLGKVPSTVAAGYPSRRLMVYADQYTWDCGLAVMDWRWNVRIANVDVNNLVNESGAADLLKLMIKACYRLPTVSFPQSGSGNPTSNLSKNMGRLVWYCCRTIREMLEIQAQNKLHPQLRWEEIDGRKVLTFKGFEIRNVDQLSIAEAQVT